MIEWIKCSDQLPEEDKTVIVACYWTDVIPLPDMMVTIKPDIKDGYIALITSDACKFLPAVKLAAKHCKGRKGGKT